jgi:hypothetical protein
VRHVWHVWSIAAAATLLGPSSSARADCRADEVAYLEAGCQGPPRQKCWPQSVHPTPGQWCGCDGKSFGGSLPTQRWAFAGMCQIEIHFQYAPVRAGDAAGGLSLEGTGFRLDLGQYRSCAEAARIEPALARARCTGEGGAPVDVAVEHRGDQLVVTERAKELGRVPSPAAQRVVAGGLQVAAPPKPPAPPTR